jgi:hypothetical protein
MGRFLADYIYEGQALSGAVKNREWLSQSQIFKHQVATVLKTSLDEDSQPRKDCNHGSDYDRIQLKN